MFSYTTSASPSISVGSLEIGGGGITLLFGPTGSGKTTLLRCINGLIPHFYGGRMRGRVTVDTLDTRERGPREISGAVGTVFQDPENQFLMLTVAEEIAFGLRNSGLDEGEISRRTHAIAASLGIGDLLGRSVFELSSGQKQRVALASVLSTGPRYILLDEPTSQLDEHGSKLFFEHLRKECSGGAMTAVMSEHRIASSSRFCSRFIGMEGGAISVDGSAQEMDSWFIDRGVDELGLHSAEEKRGVGGQTVLELTDVSVSYGERAVLQDISLSISEGEIVALLGANGSGKTSLLKSVMNFLKKGSGMVKLDGKDITDLPPASVSAMVGYLSHNPLNYLFQPTLREELDFTVRSTGAGHGQVTENLVASLGLEGKLEMFPREFSCGERELAAIACVLAGGRRCLLLDEPTRGMDYWRKSSFMRLLRGMCRRSRTSVLIATHDRTIASVWADRAYVISAGSLQEAEISGGGAGTNA